MPEADATPHRVPIVFGEVLFDRFPDGVEVIGGAPFNVAWHLHGLGERPVMVSRLGRDRRGEAIRRAMAHWGMSPLGVSEDPAAPTGLVRASVVDGEPRFEILARQAYDFIDLAQVDRVAAETRPAIVCHGTLALREAASRDALRHLHSSTRAPLFCDLNLRPPWDDAEAIEWSLAHASWLKLNVEELRRVSGAACADATEIRSVATRLRAERGWKALFVTQGSQGALAVDAEGDIHEVCSPEVEGFADSIGAGDAFTAVATLGLLRGWETRILLARAVAFAARVCTVRGATTEDRTLYDLFRERLED
jgi:fructokinase